MFDDSYIRLWLCCILSSGHVPLHNTTREKSSLTRLGVPPSCWSRPWLSLTSSTAMPNPDWPPFMHSKTLTDGPKCSGRSRLQSVRSPWIKFKSSLSAERLLVLYQSTSTQALQAYAPSQPLSSAEGRCLALPTLHKNSHSPDLFGFPLGKQAIKCITAGVSLSISSPLRAPPLLTRLSP